MFELIRSGYLSTAGIYFRSFTFPLYINDMYKACRSLEMTHYTNYTAVILTVNDIALTLNHINEDLQHIHCWLQVIRLTL